MLGRGWQRRLALVATAALAIAGLLGAPAEAQPPPDQVSFHTPTLFPRFRPGIHDYVVRCNDGPVTVRAHASGGWRAAIGNHPFRSGDFSQVVPLSAGQAFVVTVREAGQPQLYRYYVRCLPGNFPKYTFTRYGPVSPKFFSVDRAFTGPPSRYGMIFNTNGVPVWWIHEPTQDTKVLPRRESPLVQSRLFAAQMGDPRSRRQPRPQPRCRRHSRRLPRPPAIGQRPPPRRLQRRTAARRHKRLRRVQRRDRHQHRAPTGEPRRPARLGLEEPGPHRPGGDRALTGRGPAATTTTSPTGTRSRRPATR